MNHPVVRQYLIYDDHDLQLLTAVLGYSAADALRAARRAELIGPFASYRVTDDNRIYIA